MVIVGLVIGFYVLLLVGLVYSAASRRRKSRLDADILRHESDTADAGAPPEDRGPTQEGPGLTMRAPAHGGREEVSKR